MRVSKLEKYKVEKCMGYMCITSSLHTQSADMLGENDLFYIILSGCVAAAAVGQDLYQETKMCHFFDGVHLSLKDLLYNMYMAVSIIYGSFITISKC